MEIFKLFITGVLAIICFFIAGYINKNYDTTDLMVTGGVVVSGCAGVVFLVFFFIKFLNIIF